ncbi:unnamed protein product [Acanthosepion pharaonis]|uniref:Uncharacterized protein n=1 Tax=Acanthosepion pharaonis TaxID=158019 RepID=A0A812BVA0_ACAPH|nr:unnamed protein product [Sepia pharaonis]
MSLPATFALVAVRTDEFVASVKETVDNDASQSYAKIAADMGCHKSTICLQGIKEDQGGDFAERAQARVRRDTEERDEDLDGRYRRLTPLRLPAGCSTISLTTGRWTCGRLPRPTANPFDYFFLGVIEAKTNKHTDNTVDSLTAAIVVKLKPIVSFKGNIFSDCNLSIYLSIYVSNYLSIYLCKYLSIYLSFSLSNYLSGF